MAFEFKFPDVGEGVTEGTIVKWMVKEGDKVESDQNLAEIETDKAVVEIPSPKKGTILKITHKEGDVINVGEVLAVIGEKGEKLEEKKPEKKKAPESKEQYTGSVVGFLEEAPDDEEAPKEKKQAAGPAKTIVSAPPKVRKLAQNQNVNLESIKGTGPEGRITEDDVMKFSGAKKPKKVKKYDFFGYVERIPLKGIRKITAERMRECVENAALVTHHEHIDVTELSNLRKKEKEKAAKEGIHLTYLPFIIRAVVESLKNHPYVASTIEGDEIIIKKYYNMGVAVDTPDGLMVPVIKGADKKKLFELASDVGKFVEKAKSRKIDLMDIKGGVITITNIGVIASTYFTPIPNYPETCILGTGRIEERPRVHEGKVTVRKIMPISFTYDHRVIDGAEAARFMKDFIALIENPKKLLDK